MIALVIYRTYWDSVILKAAKCFPHPTFSQLGWYHEVSGHAGNIQKQSNINLDQSTYLKIIRKPKNQITTHFVTSVLES